MISFTAAAALLVGAPPVFGTSFSCNHFYCKQGNSRSCGTGRFLTEGNVIHYSNSANTVPRDEVVSAVEAALSGNQNFEVQTNLGDTIAFQDLTRNDMILSSGDLGGDFSITNAFVVDRPEVVYQVTCPADSDECNVDIKEEEPQFGRCVLKEEDTIPEECLEEEYDLNLYVAGGPHFMLGASNGGKCPNVALSSLEGAKHKIVFSSDDTVGMPSYSFGKKITLRDFLKAEEVVPPTDTEGFNLESNTCVHYAGSIWRELGYPETHELAHFVVSNVANDPKFEDMVKNHVGGLRYLAAKVVGGKNAMVSHLEEMVYSQMVIN